MVNKNMSRQIKFRAWDKDQKYMAYQGTPDLEAIQSFMHHFGGEELMQFTGLLDKNGKEIYEGDIVMCDPFSTGKIEWGVMASQWWITFTEPRKTYRELTPDYGDGQNYCLYADVIGNIHESPELIQQ